MPWARLDPEWHDHPKLIAAGPYGRALHAWAITYSSAHLTNGHIPRGAVPIELRRGIQPALNVRLFEPEPSGYVIHDYLLYNPSREDVLAQRAADAARKAAERGHTEHGRNGQFQRRVRPDSGPDANGTPA